MRNVPPDKYNVAWFKLAECVSRGEKERALGVYRLLAHSLHDSAFARQLQGDILFAFNDVASAIEHYKKAAQLYQQDERFLEAAAVYEHLVVLAHDKQEYLQHLVQLYAVLSLPAKVVVHGQSLCLLLEENHQYDDLISLLGYLGGYVEAQEMTVLRYPIIISLARNDYELTPGIQEHITSLIASLIASPDPSELNRFLATLETINPIYYQYAASSL